MSEMFTRASGGLIATTVRTVPGVRRVILCQPDGVALYDDEALEKRSTGAASVSALVGLARAASEALDVGASRGIVLYGEDAKCLVTRWDTSHIVAVVTELTSELDAVRDALARAQVEMLTEL